MAITQNMLTTILKKEIHPIVTSTILYDRKVEDRLYMITDVEQTFNHKYHHRLFIQCDVESSTVSYEVESAGIDIVCEYECL